MYKVIVESNDNNQETVFNESYISYDQANEVHDKNKHLTAFGFNVYIYKSKD